MHPSDGTSDDEPTMKTKEMARMNFIAPLQGDQRKDMHLVQKVQQLSAFQQSRCEREIKLNFGIFSNEQRLEI